MSISTSKRHFGVVAQEGEDLDYFVARDVEGELVVGERRGGHGAGNAAGNMLAQFLQFLRHR